MAFEVSADAYARFMGRYASPLGGVFLAWLGGPTTGQALDVGCGPGALTQLLAKSLGGPNVSAVDPSESFVDAIRTGLPEVAVERAPAEHLPYPDQSFDWVLAQLVVQFMSDPVQGLAEMARVARPGGVVAATVWDHTRSGGGPLTPFWRAAQAMDPGVEDESTVVGVPEGDLARLFAEAGMANPEASVLSVTVTHDTFEDWWAPYTLGVGPAGDYVAKLDPDRRDELRERCRASLPPAPFALEAKAWAVSWHKPSAPT